MTTPTRTPISTYEDILDVLDNNPKLLEATRQRVHGAEIRQLQEAVANLTRTLQEFMAATNQRLDRLEHGQDELRAGQNELRTGQDELRAGQDELRTGQDELRAGQDELRAGQDELRVGQDELRVGQRRLEQQTAEMRGQLVPLSVQRMLGPIARITGTRRIRWLEPHAIVDIVEDADTAGVPDNHLDSFLAIDLAAEGLVRDRADGQRQYIIIECSATVTKNDVARAVRNARYMTRFTGKPAQPVVAGYAIPDDVAAFAAEQEAHCLRVTSKAAHPR